MLGTRCLLFAAIAAHAMAVNAAHADVIEIVGDQAAWESALSSQETILFTEVPGGFLSDQYEKLGVLFTDGDDFISACNSCRDSTALDGGFNFIDINLAFDRPRTAVAIDFPGFAQFQLLSGGKSIYTSSFQIADPGQTLFFGLLSDRPFDAFRIFYPTGSGAFIDNVYFGDVIPAPGAMALFGLAALLARRRRRPAITISVIRTGSPTPPAP